MDDWQLIEASDGAHPEITFACRWYVTERSARVACLTHDVSTSPGHRADGCCLPVAHLCSVCAREPIAVAHKFDWHNLCARCRMIDSVIGWEHGALSATPFDARSFVAPTLLGRRPDVDQRTVYSDLRAFAATEVGRLEAVYTGPRTDAGRPLWDGWLLQHTASDEASAAAYARFVDEVHPWLRAVEPRVDDVDWLTGLASLRTRPGSSG